MEFNAVYADVSESCCNLVARAVENLILEHRVGYMPLYVDQIEYTRLRVTAYEETIGLVHDDEAIE